MKPKTFKRLLFWLGGYQDLIGSVERSQSQDPQYSYQ